MEDRSLCLTVRLLVLLPDQLSRDRLEKRLDRGIVITVALAAHQERELIPLQLL
jgi:hypothetical protein